MDYSALAAQFGTPLFIYDFDAITNRYNLLKQEFSARKSLICYAVKANSNLSLLKHLSELGAGFDCVSIGEIKRAILAGAQPYKIIFSGVAKSEDEIKEALEIGVLMINVESEAELDLIEKIASSSVATTRISIRVNPNIDPKTHPYISTGLDENKFGVDINTARAMYLKAHKSEFLEPVGIHFHIGSQLLDIDPICESARIVSSLMSELAAAGVDLRFFDIGGGLGVRYKKESEPDLYSYAQGILDALNGQNITIITEPGRFLVANAGELLTKVLYEKQSDKKRFVIVDAAMTELIRPSLYGASHQVCTAHKRQSGDGNGPICDVVGGVCESSDFLAKDINLPHLDAGDLLVIKSAGAYGFSMSSNYNSRPKAAEIAVYQGTARLIGRRESFEDLIAREREYL